MNLPLEPLQLTVETPKIEKMAADENRDPKEINEHLQLLWDDVVAEPEGIHSSNCVWGAAIKVYKCSLACCYGLLTLIFAIPIAFCFGINFACLAFQHIWCYGPLLRQCKLSCLVTGKFLRLLLNNTIAPTFEAVGLLYSQIRISKHKTKSTTDKICQV